MATFKLTGTDELLRKLKDYQVKVPKHVGAALLKEGEEIMTRSKEEFSPFDKGTLHGSGQVKMDKSGKNIVARLGYGGAAAGYALAVHETPSGFDPPSWQGKAITFKRGGPKFLERPMLEAIPGMADRLAAEIEKAFK